MTPDDELGEYVALRWPRLVRSAVLLGCTPTEAEDVVQAALVRCLLHRRKVERAADRDAYVHQVLVNTFVSSRRRRWTGERPTEHLPEVRTEDETERVDQVDAVVRSLARLSQDQRTAVVLRYYAQLSAQQMAAVLGIAPGTAKSRLSRALAVLAEDPQLAELQGAS